MFGQSNFITHNSCDRRPRLHSNAFITEKQLYPSQFGNENCLKPYPSLLFVEICKEMVSGVFMLQRDYSSRVNHGI